MRLFYNLKQLIEFLPRRKRLFLLMIVMPWFNLNEGWSQNSNLHFENLSIKNGLSHNRTQSILKDSEGFMWFGTLQGLNRYDGNTFTTFKKDESKINSISSSLIIGLYEDRDSVLWVSSLNGEVSRFDRRTGCFTKFSYQDTSFHETVYVRSFVEDNEGGIWLAMNGGGICRYNKKTNNFKHFRHNDNDVKSLSSNFAYCILPDEQSIWIATMGGGIDIFDIKSESFTHVKKIDKRGSISNDYIFYLFKDSKDRIWAGTDFGLNRYDAKSKSFINYFHDPKNSNSLCNSRITSISEDMMGRLWIATRNGLSCLSNVGLPNENFTNYYSSNSDINSLSSNELKTVLIDNNNTIWIGTLDAGINYSSLDEKEISHFKHSINDAKSVSHNVIRALFEDKDMNLWIGTDGGGLNLMRPGTKTFEKWQSSVQSSAINHNQILAIEQDRFGDIWLGTYGGGLKKVKYADIKNPDKKYIQYTHQPSNPKSLINDIIQDIFEDKDGRLWIGTEGGLCLYNRMTDTFDNSYVSTDKPNQLSDNRIQSNTIIQDSQGFIWVGTWNGLNKMVENRSEATRNIEGINVPPHSIRFKNYFHSANDTNSISDNRILSIFEDSNKSLWVGTYGKGINRYDKKRAVFVPYSEKDGLANDVVYTILEDNSQNLWMSTNNGLSKFSLKTNTFRNYDENDGLQSNYFYWGSGLKRANGDLVFGGTNGFNIFSPNTLKDNLIIPPIYITGIQINGKYLQPSDSKYSIKTAIWRTKEIVIPYGKEVISLEFAALNFNHPIKNKYVYKLEGFNDSWITVGATKSATYTNLSPGQYIFRVKGTNNDGIWNDSGATLKITITPPYWATWWFRLMVALAILILIWVILLLKLQQLKKQQELLKEMVEERTQELHKANTILCNLNSELSEINTLLEETNEEVTEQKEIATHQRDEISLKNQELERLQNNLEDLVHERTEELVDAKKMAEESERLKAAFLANMSHEIRTPLNTIVGFSTLLTVDNNNLDEVVEYSEHISESSQKLLLLIDDILELSIIEAKQLKRNDTRFEIGEFLSNYHSYSEARNSTKQLAINFKNTVTKADLKLTSDRKKIKQILDYLMHYALKKTEFGYVEIGFEYKDNSYIISVKDSGVGVSQTEINSLFNWIEKPDINFSNDPHNTTGLGLIISTRFAELLGGKLWAESKVGFGTTFHFSLPEEQFEL